MTEGEGYLDIVWRQFKKNRAAVWSLWVVAALVLVALFAPLLASNIPFVFHDGVTTIYPWFFALFHPSQAIDYVFNLALIVLAPWIVISLAANWLARQRGISGGKRLGLAAIEFVAMMAALAILLSFPSICPSNPYGDKDFPEQEFNSPQTKHGVYPPISFGPSEIDLLSRFTPPGEHLPKGATKSNQEFPHLLGTADNGEDVLTELIYGTRISMTVGLVAVSIYLVIGIVAGACAGYFGGASDIIISRIIETVLLFPTLFLILALVGLLDQSKPPEMGGQRLYIAMVVIGITGWPTIARLTRGEVLKQRSLDYATAAQASGASHWRILFRHILPNSLSPALVSVPFGISGAIVLEASLSVLGFGAETGQPSWGSLLQVAIHDYHHWWLVLFPSLAIFITVTTFNLVGNGLRDAMDPRLRI